MNDFTIRRRLAEDGMSKDDVEELLSAMAEQRNDEARDRAAEEQLEKAA